MQKNQKSIAERYQLNSFQQSHLLTLVQGYEKGHEPVHLYLRKYLKANRSIGGNDRRKLSESLFFLIRHRSLIDYQLPKPLDWPKRINTPFVIDIEAKAHTKVSFPKWLYTKIESQYGEKRAIQICKTSNEAAPITIRVNTLKCDKETFRSQWQKTYPMKPCSKALNALSFAKRENFLVMPPFKEGLFEVQDEGSQLIAEMLRACPKSRVLDYCAGAGGKSLSIAALMQNSGQIFLHDIRKGALKEAKKRLARAGALNAQILHTEKLKKNLYQQFFTHLLLDVPCSGTGTLRRNPDHKWRLHEDEIQTYVTTQRNIFAKSLRHIKPGGYILYATCSLLTEENEMQTKYFLETYPLTLVEEKKFLPTSGKWDGFYGALYKYLAP